MYCGGRNTSFSIFSVSFVDEIFIWVVLCEGTHAILWLLHLAHGVLTVLGDALSAQRQSAGKWRTPSRKGLAHFAQIPFRRLFFEKCVPVLVRDLQGHCVDCAGETYRRRQGKREAFITMGKAEFMTPKAIANRMKVINYFS